MKNDQPVTNVKMEQLGGTVSAGEFGTMMSEIFEPQSQAAVFLGSLGHAARPPHLRVRLRHRAGIFAISCQGGRDAAGKSFRPIAG